MAKGGDDTQTTTVDPWAAQQPYLQQLYSGAQDIYNQNLMQPFEGSTVASQSAATTGGQQYNLGYAQNIAPGVATEQRNAWSSALNAPDISNNPYIAPVVEASLRPITQNYEENIRPNLQSAAIKSGAYGGARADIVNAQAARDYNNTIADTTSRIYQNAYNKGLDVQQGALGLAPSVISTGLQPGNIISGVGAQQDQYQQAQINDAVRLWEQRQSLPWEQLRNYGALITGNVGNVTTAPTPTTSPLAGAAGGALTGASLANMLNMGGGWTGALAGLGAVAGGYG